MKTTNKVTIEDVADLMLSRKVTTSSDIIAALDVDTRSTAALLANLTRRGRVIPADPPKTDRGVSRWRLNASTRNVESKKPSAPAPTVMTDELREKLKLDERLRQAAVDVGLSRAGEIIKDLLSSHGKAA